MAFDKSSRRAVRRALRTRCQAVHNDRFDLLGERVMDLSPRGMLVACDKPAEVGDDIIVSFRAPGADDLWLDAEAEVARIVHGERAGDPGYCVGLDFRYIERSARAELLVRLAGYPPPVPQRRKPAGRGERTLEPSVIVRPIVRVWPRGLSQQVPVGAFAFA